MDLIKTLNILTQAPGVTGFEKTAALAAQPLFSQFCDTSIDRNQSLIADLRGASGEKTVLLDAHLDEIGLIVTGIDDMGFVSVGNVGLIQGRAVLGAEVLIHGSKAVYGVIGATPPHLQSPDEKKSAQVNNCRIDTGYTKEQLSQWVRLGDSVTFVGPITKLANDRVMGKAMDDRACCAILLRVAELLSEDKPACNVRFVLSSGEEINSLGSATAAFDAAPDYAIVVDVTHARVPGSPDKSNSTLGSGPAIGIAPILSKDMYTDMKAVAVRENIPYTVDVIPGRTFTDSEAIAMSRAGVPTSLISLPLKYMHTPSEVADLRDIENCAKLMAAFVRGL